MRFALGLTVLLLAAPASALECVGRSGYHTAVLVELYTSEGCSSCPPADRWLSSLGKRGDVPQRIVPIALHVDYWDYIGWKDPYAKRAFSQRQRNLTALQRLALVYTPQVMLQGRDFRAWGTEAFDEAVTRINARRAQARLSLSIHSIGAESLEVEASAELLDPAQRKSVALYLAVYENRLFSTVQAGENQGRVLEHDYVVLEWRGPFGFGSAPRITERHVLPLLPRGTAAASGVVGFVQNRRTGEVLQALMLSAC